MTSPKISKTVALLNSYDPAKNFLMLRVLRRRWRLGPVFASDCHCSAAALLCDLRVHLQLFPGLALSIHFCERTDVEQVSTARLWTDSASLLHVCVWRPAPAQDPAWLAGALGRARMARLRALQQTLQSVESPMAANLNPLLAAASSCAEPHDGEQADFASVTGGPAEEEPQPVGAAEALEEEAWVDPNTGLPVRRGSASAERPAEAEDESQPQGQGGAKRRVHTKTARAQ
jgi:hypothetical protein